MKRAFGTRRSRVRFASCEQKLRSDSRALHGNEVAASYARTGEMLTIYLADIFYDTKETLRHPYINAYNAKDDGHRESIFGVVSNDCIHWKRYDD